MFDRGPFGALYLCVVDVVIVDGVRTPFTGQDAGLRCWHSVDLLAHVLQALVRRGGVDPATVDAVLAGCATPVGEQALDVARNAVLAAGWPEQTTGVTVDAAGASGLVALHDAAMSIQAGVRAAVIAAAVESVSRVPAGSSTGVAVGRPFGPTLHDRYVEAGGLRSPGAVAEVLAERFALSRGELDDYVERSRERAVSALHAGVRKAAIEPVCEAPGGAPRAAFAEHDQLAAVDPSAVLPLFEVDGMITAANLAPPADAAAAMLLMSSARAASAGFNPQARVAGVAQEGVSMREGSDGASVATRALAMAEATFDHCPIIEVHEDTAVTPLAFCRATGTSMDRVNVNGGSLALGNPAAPEGLRIVMEVAQRLAEGEAPRGLVVMAGTAGLSAAVVLEALSPSCG